MKIMLKGLVVATVLAAGFAGAAQARPVTSQSVKYLDETGHLVGQHYLLCDGRNGNHGNVHTAYTITEMVTCSSPTSEPETAPWIVPGKVITDYTLPGNISIQSACLVASCDYRGVPEVTIVI